MAIDQSMFMLAFGRDVDYHDLYSELTYLDRLTGDVIWLYEFDDDAYAAAGLSPEDNRETFERVLAEPERYLRIPGLSHGDHHDILRRFLRSNWTDDDDRWRHAMAAYSRSIGRWKRDVRDEGAVRAFHAYQEEGIDKLADEFLRENGVVPEWR